MSSHVPKPPPVDLLIIPANRSRPLVASSMAEGGNSKHDRQHAHRHSIIHRDKDNSRDINKDKEKDEKALHITNSNLQPTLSPTGAESGRSRSENPTPAQSQTASRRTSLLGLNADQEGMAPGGKLDRIPSKEAELTREREGALLRAAFVTYSHLEFMRDIANSEWNRELRNELGDINTHSNTIIQRLDNTYYSVLEKLGSLRNTITSVKELSVMTRRLNEEFQTEGDAVAKEVGASLDAFQNFEFQQKRIEELAARVKTGRDKVKLLGGRVDKVRNRVNGWERADQEWQNLTRKRLRVLWIVMSVIAALMVVLSVFHYTPARLPAQVILPGLNSSEVVESVPELESLRNGTWSPKKAAMDLVGNASRSDKRELAEDPRLRLFDEL